MKVTFEVNGYRLSALVKDPAEVERSLTSLAKVLTEARAHMAQIGRRDLADRLGGLSCRLQTSGEAIDDAFDHAYKEVVRAATDVCSEVARPGGMRSPDDRNTQIYGALTWSLLDLVTVRVGGRGTFVHPGGDANQVR